MNKTNDAWRPWRCPHCQHSTKAEWVRTNPAHPEIAHIRCLCGADDFVPVPDLPKQYADAILKAREETR